MIDLRSDTVTRPTPEMLQAMINAPVGDDVFGEDPTVNAFEERVAAMFGQQAGLFVPSGVMGNQICLYELTNPGDEIILDNKAHIFNYEASTAAWLSSVQLRPLQGKNGILDPEAVEAAVRTKNDWDPHTRVIAVENTTNKGGGAVYSMPVLKTLREIADRHGLFLHLDGARIWNALAENPYSAAEIGSLFDTISVCFSKGLGAPVGSMVLSTAERIRSARRTRKMLGGGMRQTGLLAAAAAYALDHHFDKLKTDNERARKLAHVIQKKGRYAADPENVFTNILLFDTPGPAEQTLSELAQAGISMTAFGPQTIRAVFHFQITDDEFTQVCDFFK
ncbi:MAG: aminotransferase class I/II-fold pyridoxal phosphate-dependent enzyme [Candidatus Cyclonatronum sp.]|uniref:threonine aldolase family protein n=1 Tax=Cyclonatronum sp. TaxID=3024185 RepID=UPI0025C401A0|nr:GntG family PLP-dependent aldolase [Cyclonatronum sp.]MCC5932760.1 aminotransferase class I/II-fold pyridoxal phosphate-dependent enzyme [Balneolales bacterium]MCH8486125.1 aminotransferase class I/II-fold pyridoxal phosphate-dependent enzyme [Cyclonatronum sp.]